MDHATPVDTQTPPSAPADSEADVKPNHVLLYIGVPLALAVIVSLILVVFTRSVNIRAPGASSTVSGVIRFSSLKPEPGDDGEIRLKYRPSSSTGEYVYVGQPVALTENAPWSLQLASGESYEIIAELYIDSKVVANSEPLILTSPARNQEIKMQVNWSDLPERVVAGETTVLAGTVQVNGIIANGAQLDIRAREASLAQQEFVTVVTVPVTGQLTQWAWDKALPLKQYEVRAHLRQDGAEVGVSSIIAAEGPDRDIQLVVNSTTQQPTPLPTAIPQPTTTSVPQQTAVPPTTAPTATPAQRGKISGTVYVNGPKDKNTSALLMWRTPGQGNYTVITRIPYPEQNGQYWEFADLPAGQQYEIIAVLQVNEQNTATSNSQTVAVPASSVNFTINTGVSMNRPATPIFTTCGPKENSRYKPYILIPKETHAGNYWLQVGTANGSADTYNSKFRPLNNNEHDQNIQVTIDENRTYYARYAYSLCTNCSADINFSPFSNTIEFKCE